MTEPSEAEVEAARQALLGIRWTGTGSEVARAALTAAAQVREGMGQQNMIIGTLGTIANMPDEENEWDGTDKFWEAREMARTVMAHLPGTEVLGMRKGE